MGNSKEGNRGEDLSGLGATAIISRCIKHLWTHGGLYLGILVLILLPTVAVEQLIFSFTGFTNPLKPEVVQKLATGNFTDVEVHPAVIIPMAASFLAYGLLQAVFSAIQHICIVYTVASFLTNKTVILADAASAVGRLWKPVTLTSLSLIAATYGSMAMTVAIMYALYPLSSFPLIVLVGLLDLALVVFISFAFQMGLVVPVLEGVHGWRALSRSWKLLQGKKWVALKMMILLGLLAMAATLLFQFFLQLVLMLLGIFTVSTTGPVVTFVVSLVMSTVDIVLVIGTQTFLYFSCKALHQESITDSAFFQSQVMKGGYEKITQHPELYDVESANTPGSKLESI